MESNRLDKELIDNPSLWVLTLRLSVTDLHIAAFSLVEDNSLIYRRVPLDRVAPSPIKAIEDAVYDNPLLLSNFKHVYCLVDTHATIIVPAPGAYDSKYSTAIFSACHNQDDTTLHADILPEMNAAILTGIDTAIDRFLHRTFSNMTIMNHLAPLCRYFHSSRSNSVKTYANFREKSMDVIIIDGNRLLHANTYSFNDPIDATYYIMACRARLNLSNETNELLLSGDSTIREKITPVLRRHIALVMPVIFPPRMFRAGRDAMQAPFDLIVTPLCE